MTSAPRCRPWYRVAVLLYDRLYRTVHGLDSAASEVGPGLRVELRRSLRYRRLPDGTRLRPGTVVGLLHLNNDRVTALHSDGLPPHLVGLDFRRQILTSLRVLASQASGNGPLARVEAFAATTVFHYGLARLGFHPERGGSLWLALVSSYQRLLLASLHPAATTRARRATGRRARTLWMSRRDLVARYGDGSARGDGHGRIGRAAGGEPD